MIDALPGQKCAEPLWREATIVKPVDVPWGVISSALVWQSPHDQQVASRRWRINLRGGTPGILLNGSSGGGCGWWQSSLACDNRGVPRKKCVPTEELLRHLSEDVISAFYQINHQRSFTSQVNNYV